MVLRPVQPSPPSFEARRPPAAKHRLFFAVQPDRETAERLFDYARGLCRRYGLAGLPVGPERLHITLNFVGVFQGRPPILLLDRALKAASAVAHRPFRIALNQVQNWARGGEDAHPVVLCGDEGVIGVDSLRAALQSALGGAHSAGKPKGFTPHLTLLWDRAGAAEDLAEAFAWTVREFVLIESPYGESQHHVVARWPLGG